MKILIVGATGATGKLLVDQLLENGHEVKAFARNEKKFSKVYWTKRRRLWPNLKPSRKSDKKRQRNS